MSFSAVTVALLLGGGILAADAILAAAQIPPEFAMTQRLGTGARALGMGGAYVAVAEDYSALFYNPAGLAQIRRVEFAGAIDRLSTDQITSYLGHRETTPLTKSNLQSLGFAYPFPTYRGSLVLGFSYDREIPLDMAYYRRGSQGEILLEEEEILEAGALNSWRVGLAGDVSPELSLGFSALLRSGSSTRDRSFSYDGQEIYQGDQLDTVYVRQVYKDVNDFSSVSGSLGALLRSGAGLRFGLCLHLPEKLTVQRDLSDYDVTSYEGPPRPGPVQFQDSYYAGDEISFPFRVAVGGSYVPQGPLSNLLLSADLTYADWSQIKLNDEPVRTEDRGFAYRSTVDIRLGAEYTLPTYPIRLRAGFISQPLAYRLIATDVYVGGYEAAHLLHDRRYFTFGGGVLLQESLTLDAAFMFGEYERSGSSIIGETVEKVKERRAYIGAAFRLL